MGGEHGQQSGDAGQGVTHSQARWSRGFIMLFRMAHSLKLRAFLFLEFSHLMISGL